MAVKTRNISKNFANNFLKKAEEYSQTMKDELLANRWNATVLNSIHCGISSVDAVTAALLGLRHAGERHEEVISLIRTLPLPPDEINSKCRQLQDLLRIKNAAEYEERLMTESDAASADKNADRLFSWAKDIVKKKLG